MGTYVNPKEKSKEEWIAEGIKEKYVEEIELYNFKKLNFFSLELKDKYALVLLNNGMFTALLVCDSDNELNYIKRILPNESRPFKCYIGTIEEINKVAA